MMKASLFYGVQFAQSRLLLASQAERTSDIDRLLLPGADVDAAWQTTAQWSTHLPATQHIRGENGDGSVDASWTTLGAEISGDEATGTVRYVVGRWDNRFVRHEGVWRFRVLRWRPLLRTLPWSRHPDALLDTHRADPSAWIDLPPALGTVSDEGVSARTLATLELRNLVMGWCDRYNTHGLSALDDSALSTTAARSAREMLTTDSTARTGYLLATSPVVAVDDDASTARVFASVTFLAPRGDDQLEHRRGSLLVRLSRSSASRSWAIDDVEWYRYATLQPWAVDPTSPARKGNTHE